MRSLDEFMFGSARFQISNVRDGDKSRNRVVKNLLYYQTNYFVMCLGIYGLLIILNPQKVFCGLIIQSIIIAVLLRYLVKRPHSKFKHSASWSNISQGNTHRKLYFLPCVLICGYLFLHWSNTIFLTIFTVMLPVSLTFIHASLRLRNIKNKMVNTMESFNPSTPMGVFLDILNISMDS
ncbi:PRA1 family protein 3 [Ceratitis capitata]|uniref:PRA1 family protein 3 n=1 Tax=Ceratitis capitata TaxID=7213 RepID=UPI000C6C73D6|nr:PRA1 family protein 3 [Ceratitis capitata]